jgi:hypothetical protein
MEEINIHLDRLEKNGILEDGRLKGAIVIGHGDQDEVENGFTMHNISTLSRLNRLWMPDKEPFFVYFSCLSAEGGHKENNMVNSTSIALPPEVEVIGCPTLVEDVDFEIEKGEFIPDALELSTYFSLTNDTFTANRSSAVYRQAQRTRALMSKTSSCTADFAFYREAVNLGITDKNDIRVMCTNSIPPKTYSSLKAAGWERYEFLAHRPQFDMSYARAIEYADAGVRGRQNMKKLHRSNISPQEIRVLRAATKTLKLSNSVIQAGHLVDFKNAGIEMQKIIAHLYNRETDPKTIIRLELERKALASTQGSGVVKVATR